MKSLLMRARYFALVTASGSLFVLDGCFLSDQQLAGIWQSVLSTGLNTIVTNLLTSAAQTAGT